MTITAQCVTLGIIDLLIFPVLNPGIFVCFHFDCQRSRHYILLHAARFAENFYCTGLFFVGAAAVIFRYRHLRIRGNRSCEYTAGALNINP